MARLILNHLSLAYGDRLAVEDLSAVIEPGGAVAVIGPNGSGKSTLLKGIAGLQPIASGDIRLEGARSRDIAYLPQDPAIDRSFPITLEDLVALGFFRRLGLFGGLGRAERARLAAAIAAVGLSGLERRPIASLSGGQFQRALFARLTVQDAPVLLLDEPFSALDLATTADLVAMTLGWAQEGRVVLAVLHDDAIVRRLCAKSLILARTLVAWGDTHEVVTEENHARTQAIARAWPGEDAA